MDLKNQVCSQELSMELNTLGFEQDSYFVWVKLCDGYYAGLEYSLIKRDELKEGNISIPAYTVVELGEILQGIKSEERVKIFIEEDEYIVDRRYDCWCRGKNLANVMAEKIIYLRENNLI